MLYGRTEPRIPTSRTNEGVAIQRRQRETCTVSYKSTRNVNDSVDFEFNRFPIISPYEGII